MSENDSAGEIKGLEEKKKEFCVEVDRLKAEIEKITDAWLAIYVKETKEGDAKRRYRVVWPWGRDRWFYTLEDARAALLHEAML